MDAHASLPQRMLEILEGLLRLPASDLRTTLVHACDLIAGATGADKVDAFLYDPSRDCLVAVGTSNQPMSALQRKLGLNVLQISNGGRAVEVFQTGSLFVDGHVERDEGELKGIREALGTRSSLAVPLEVGGERRGVVLAASQKNEYFGAEDARMAETVARWVGLVAHRAELTEAIRRSAVEEGRRAGAEELVTILAHDLRNYVAPLRARICILRQRVAGQSAAVDDIAVMDRAVDRIERLVSDILDVARLDRGLFQVAAEAVDLGTLAREVAGIFASPHHPVRLSLQTADPIVVPGEPARLRQCMENLVANAVQMSPVHAPVTVSLQREVQADGKTVARIDVIDEGPGIAPEVLPFVFDRFASSRLREGGLGLGLYLAKRIAAAHGGDLLAESEPGKGARFTLTLPAMPA